MNKFGVRVSADLKSIVFPYFGNQKSVVEGGQNGLVGVRIWTVKDTENHKISKRTIPKYYLMFFQYYSQIVRLIIHYMPVLWRI